MREIKTISIKCETKDTLELAELTEMQGGLKERTDIDFDKIKLSIIKYGFSFPLFVWKSGKTNYLLDGHGRFATLCKMQKDGYMIPPLPVVYIQAKDKKEAKQKLLRLNSQYGKMTKESVLEFAEDIDLNFDEIALPDTVIDFTDQSEETAETEGDDEAPEVDEKSEPVSKRGEMYELGNSILMCGDSTSAEDVARLMGGEKADMVFTDPPYGNGTSGKYGRGQLGVRTIAGDEDLSVFNNFVSIMNVDKIIYFLQWRTLCESLETISNKGLKINTVAVWDKKNAGLNGAGRISEQWEAIVFAGNIKYRKFGGNVFSISREHHKREDSPHPHQKPIKLLAEIFDFIDGCKTILDPFGGSGSTLIACEKTNRKCRMVELDPIYCDVIRKRYTKWCLANNRPLTSGCLQ